MYMRIDGHDQMFRREIPEAQVKANVGTDHPACVKEEPLARGTGSWVTDKVTHPGVGSPTSETIRYARQGLAKVTTGIPEFLGHQRANAAILRPKRGRIHQQSADVGSTIDSMTEPSQLPGKPPRAQLLNAASRTRAEHL